ncbi:MAG: phosphotransferase family protein [Planctomycetia bacterium]|nr:phosphotransferase family protein [Planctomycetia bacterium]
MTTDLNATAPIRSGEELPLESLAAYLREELPVSDETLDVEQFPAGHSNLTYLLRWGEREFVLRRPPFGNQVKTAHDMSREYRILSRLYVVYPPAPRPELYCDDESILGAPFYLMERRRGMILRRSLPPGLDVTPALARRMSCALVDNLAALHALDVDTVGLADFGRPEGYVERQVNGWIQRYEKSQTSDVPSMNRVAVWLQEHRPAESGCSVIHNDYKYDNVLLAAEDPARLVAVLDWEMATIGDPLMDLGTTLAYWVEPSDPGPLQQAAFGPTALPGGLTRREVIARYEERTGRKVANPAFYYCFGLYKLAVIVQQIYARFVRGHTADPRFAQLGQLVMLLSGQADQVVARGW